MKKGHRKRLELLQERDAAASALGHGILDCGIDNQQQVCAFVLSHLAVAHSRSDVLLAMHNQKIAPHSANRLEFDNEVRVDAARRARQAENARLAREELVEFKAWKAERARQKKAKQARSVPADAGSGEQEGS